MTEIRLPGRCHSSIRLCPSVEGRETSANCFVTVHLFDELCSIGNRQPFVCWVHRTTILIVTLLVMITVGALPIRSALTYIPNNRAMWCNLFFQHLVTTPPETCGIMLHASSSCRRNPDDPPSMSYVCLPVSVSLILTPPRGCCGGAARAS